RAVPGRGRRRGGEEQDRDPAGRHAELRQADPHHVTCPGRGGAGRLPRPRPRAGGQPGGVPEMRSRARAVLLAMILGPATAVAVAAEPVPARVRLESPGLHMEVSPRLGGRMLHLSLPGAPNLLLVGEAVDSQPDPKVSASADNIPHMGHEVWTGPQSQCWTGPALNPARPNAAARTPPEPLTSNAPA